jgi:hypothetical protein
LKPILVAAVEHFLDSKTGKKIRKNKSKYLQVIMDFSRHTMLV